MGKKNLYYFYFAPNSHNFKFTFAFTVSGDSCCITMLADESAIQDPHVFTNIFEQKYKEAIL